MILFVGVFVSQAFALLVCEPHVPHPAIVDLRHELGQNGTG